MTTFLRAPVLATFYVPSSGFPAYRSTLKCLFTTKDLSTSEGQAGTKDTKNGIAFKLQHPQSVEFRRVHQENCGYRVDVLVEDKTSISGDILNRVAATIPPNLRLVPNVLFFDSFVLFVSFVVEASYISVRAWCSTLGVFSGVMNG